jgi:hypothetical protein
MSYPFRPNPNYGELFETLKKFKVSLCSHPGLSIQEVETGETFDSQYLHKKGYGAIGVVFRKSGESITWSKVESICTHFNIPETEFGLTAGWPLPDQDAGE